MVLRSHPPRDSWPLPRVLARAFRRRRRPGKPVRKNLRDCPACGRPFVCATDWGTSGESHWWVLLRCGECDCQREVVITNEQAAALDRELAYDEYLIAQAAGLLDSERMTAQVEAFTAALERDLIDASDFARG